LFRTFIKSQYIRFYAFVIDRDLPMKKKPIVAESSPVSKEMIEQQEVTGMAKHVALLSDLPLELRKKEASKPLYLARYE